MMNENQIITPNSTEEKTDKGPHTTTPDQMIEITAEVDDTFSPMYTTPTPKPNVSAPSEKTHGKAAQENQFEYYSQMGDSLPVLAKRFNVSIDEIQSQDEIPSQGLIKPGELLLIPNRFQDTGPSEKLLPDSEIVFSPSAVDFDIQSFLSEEDGYLANYWEPRGDFYISGAQIIMAEAIDYSINPRIILALMEQNIQIITRETCSDEEIDFVLGWDTTRQGFSRQLDYAIRILSTGYYSWREGSLKELTFPDGSKMTLSPTLNAGSAALQYYFSQMVNQEEWYDKLYGENSISHIEETLFGDPWLREQSYPPLLPTDLVQPELQLPFEVGRPWNYTSGPHSVWSWYGANGALDFAPAGVIDCSQSDEWVTASAPGTVLRTQKGFLAVELDNDGNEQIGWTIIYMHIHNDFPLQLGDILEQDDYLGHPSCEGGRATGTHLHIARKYNGEWILADGPVPFVLSDWEAKAGNAPYEGELIKGDEVITSSTFGEHCSKIIREP